MSSKKDKYAKVKFSQDMGNKTLEMLSELAIYEPESMHAQLPIVWDKGKDFLITDKFGNQYIDFTSGIFVTNAGHNFTSTALMAQATKLVYCYNFMNEQRLKLLRLLVEISPKTFNKAFLLSSGSEAIDCAIKLMRLKAKRLSRNKKNIISFYGAMHGKTMLGELLKGEDTSWTGKCDFIHHLPFPVKYYDPIKKLRSINPKTIAGIIFETYQGWSARMYPDKFVKEIADYAKKHSILICFDEIQGGMFRTGPLYCFEHYNIIPDLTVIGKGLGNGLPISAVIGRKELFDGVHDLSSTYSANPLSCSSAYNTLKHLIECNVKEAVEAKGVFLFTELHELKKKYPKYIREINSKGLVGAIIFENEAIATKVCFRAMEKGLLLVWTKRESVKIGPPLTICEDALMEGLEILKDSVDMVLK